VEQTYDYAAWYDLIRRLRPDAVISVKGPDTRWVGNEGGIGRATEWSVIPLSQPAESFTWPDMQGADLGSRAKLTPGSHLWWYPAEVNTSILNGWFWSAEKRPKSAARLVDYFYTSIGRNGNMLLNLAPDTRGLIPDDQLASLRRMAEVVDATFAKDLAAAAGFSADSSNPANRPALLHDGDLDTWWEAARGRTSATVTLTLPVATTFDVVSLQEAVDHRSQRIEAFVIETWDGSSWTAPLTVDEQTTVGHKRLLRLAVPVTTDRMRVRITGSRLEPTLAEMGLFQQALPAAPAVSERSREGLITLSHPHPAPIVYTLDGTPPTARSPVYDGPVSLPDGGTLQAAVLTPEGRLGLTAMSRRPRADGMDGAAHGGGRRRLVGVRRGPCDRCRRRDAVEGTRERRRRAAQPHRRHGPRTPDRGIHVPAAPGLGVRGRGGSLPVRDQPGRQALDDPGGARDLRQHQEQSIAPRGDVRPRGGPVLPLHRPAGRGAERLGQRGGDHGPADGRPVTVPFRRRAEV
jgi:hypothetical protein